MDGDVVAAVARATRALAQLNASQPRLASLGAIASALLRLESAASSRIEDLAVSQKRLARAALERDRRPGGDQKAIEILGNVEAMKTAVALGAGGEAISVEDIAFNPLSAVYVPPPPDLVRPLLEDLCRFMARDDLAPIVQAAIAHAQFENIHPFADGNGRVGRTLIHVVLRRTDEAVNYVPPVSVVLAAVQRSYIAGLAEFSAGDVSSWCDLFASATEQSVYEAQRLAAEIDELEAVWLERFGATRSDSAVRQVLSHLPGQPVIDVSAARALTGRSHAAIQKALAQLEQAEVVRPLNEKKWGRSWECTELLDLVEAFEKAVTSPP